MKGQTTFQDLRRQNGQKQAEEKQTGADLLKKGRSTLHKWECLDCGMAVRMGIKGDPRLVHDVCSEKKGEKVFPVQHDGLRHTIYEGDGGENRPEEIAPPIIIEINEQLREGLPDDVEIPTIEGIASKFGINKNLGFNS